MTKGGGEIAELPPIGERVPLHVSAGCVRKAGGSPPRSSTSGRNVLSLSFVHRPDRMDASRPSILSPFEGSTDRVGLHFHAHPRASGSPASSAEGVRLSGSRKPQSRSQAKDYFLIYSPTAGWCLEPVDDAITNIKPIPNSQQTSTPPIPDDYMEPCRTDDPDPWDGLPTDVTNLSNHHDMVPNSEQNTTTAAVSAMSVPQIRSHPVSPVRNTSASPPLSPRVHNGVAGKSTAVAQNGHRRRIVSATKVTGTESGDDDASVEDVVVTDAVAIASSEDESGHHQRHATSAGKSVAHKSVGSKGQSTTGGSRKRKTGTSTGGGGGSDSESASGSSGSSGSGSSGSSSEDSVEWTDESDESDSD